MVGGGKLIISDNIEYKTKIKNKLISSSDIITLLNNPAIPITTPSKYFNVNIIPYIRIPDGTETTNNFICYDYSSRVLSQNDTYKAVTINVIIMCQKDNISTIYGSRHDVLGGLIIETLNHSDFLGFELELVVDKESVFEHGYIARELQFKNLAQNSMVNGVRRN